MPVLGVALAVLGGLVGGTFAGLWIGGKVRGRARLYWVLNGVHVLLCMALNFAGLVTGQVWLSLGALGLMGGGITGLKYGYSESIGVWRTIDTWTGNDASMRLDDDTDHPDDSDDARG